MHSECSFCACIESVMARGAGTRWEFVCLLPLFDPPRHDTKETIERCREKGIDVKMVTGDQLLIGKETSRQLGLGTDMYSTEALLEVCAPCHDHLVSLPISHAHSLDHLASQAAPHLASQAAPHSHAIQGGWCATAWPLATSAVQLKLVDMFEFRIICRCHGAAARRG